MDTEIIRLGLPPNVAWITTNRDGSLGFHTEIPPPSADCSGGMAVCTPDAQEDTYTDEQLPALTVDEDGCLVFKGIDLQCYGYGFFSQDRTSGNVYAYAGRPLRDVDGDYNVKGRGYILLASEVPLLGDEANPLYRLVGPS